MNKSLMTRDLNPEEFKEHYFLKEELKDFCRQDGLRISGSKQDLENRIIHYLATGEKLNGAVLKKSSSNASSKITLDSKLGDNFRCSEDKRLFLKEK